MRINTHEIAVLFALNISAWGCILFVNQPGILQHYGVFIAAQWALHCTPDESCIM